jgi:uncharacterized protein YukE
VTDPQALRAQAQRCRTAAAAINQQAPALTDLFGTLGRQHPVAPIWAGPAATAFTDVLNGAQRDVAAAVRDAEDYAQALLTKAGQLEHDATQAELTPSAGAAPR